MSQEQSSAVASVEATDVMTPAPKPTGPRVRRGPGAAPERAAGPEDPNAPPVRVKLIRGQYVGLGCPDPNDRLYEQDLEFGYTHEHPARAHFREIPAAYDPETQQMTPIRDEYVDGEVIQLWPITEWEAQLEETKKMRAADKRHTFSRKEALRRAAEMVKQKIAQVVP